MFGLRAIKTWSSTQSVIALSSGESEYYGIVKGASVLLGALSIARDFGVTLNGRLSMDSSAAKGIASRLGLGKVKHLHTQYLWVQERVSNGDFTLRKIWTDENPGDLMTKNLDKPKLDKFFQYLGFCFRDGRHDLAPKLATSNLDLQMIEEQQWLEPGSAQSVRNSSRTKYFDISDEESVARHCRRYP